MPPPHLTQKRLQWKHRVSRTGVCAPLPVAQMLAFHPSAHPQPCYSTLGSQLKTADRPQSSISRQQWSGKNRTTS